MVQQVDIYYKLIADLPFVAMVLSAITNTFDAVGKGTKRNSATYVVNGRTVFFLIIVKRGII